MTPFQIKHVLMPAEIEFRMENCFDGFLRPNCSLEVARLRYGNYDR